MSIASSLMERLKKIKYGMRGGWQSINEIDKRATLSIFNYNELVKPLDFYPFIPHKENNLYGNGSVIKKYLPELDYSKTTIEHGLYIGSLVPNRHLNKKYKNIITFSKYRSKFISPKTNQNIITVGPYIKYAETLYSLERISSEKDKLGKILVVFPSHSIDSVQANYNIVEFIEYIDAFKNSHNFQSVIVCMYWKDIELNSHKQYENSGFKIATAGHSYDPNFLSRLKTIILLSDSMLTNTVGTHVGYSIHLNKPVKIWDGNKIEYSFLTGNEIEAEKELNQRSGKDLETHLNDIEKIKLNFSRFDGRISDTQLDCVQYYWGI